VDGANATCIVSVEADGVEAGGVLTGGGEAGAETTSL
jgi:hypothetical protein